MATSTEIYAFVTGLGLLPLQGLFFDKRQHVSTFHDRLDRVEWKYK